MADYKSTHTGAEIDAGIDKAVTADTNWNLLMANLGVGRWANQDMYSFSKTNAILDNLFPYYTTANRMFANGSFRDFSNNTLIDGTITVDFKGMQANCSYLFHNYQNTGVLNLSNLNNLFGINMFAFCKFTEIHATNFKCIKLPNKWVDGYNMFFNCSNLKIVDGFDLRNIERLDGCFYFDSNLEQIINCHFDKSFAINSSTKFTESALVDIISQLETVTTAQTLTMGATNLAKLTDAEKKVATDKGWVLA